MNKNLKNLIGGPQKVNNYFCNNCDLRLLEGAPEECDQFICIGNKNLKNLIGGPKKVKEYNCSRCGFETLKGAPESVNKFICYNNPVNFTKEEIKKYIKNFTLIVNTIN